MTGKEVIMDKQKQLQEKVDRTLEMMGRMESLKAGPYFYTRLESKLCSREREKRYGIRNIFRIFDRRLRPVLVTLLIVMNVISALFFLLESQNTRTSQEEYQANISLFLENYSLNSNIYDIDVTEKLISARED